MRKEGWELLLDRYIQNVSKRRYKWGKCDCLIFVSDAAKKICGKDPMSAKKRHDIETARGLYDNKKDAYSLIKKFRGSMPKVMDAHFERIKPNFAQRGDIVQARLSEGSSFGLVYHGQALFKLKNEGLRQLPLSKCKYAWRVE